VETFQALKERQTSDSAASGESLRGRVNLLNWDGNGSPPGLFPPRDDRPDTPEEGPR
jgi:nitrate reductase beta subunit